jgi:hypothetical protein
MLWSIGFLLQFYCKQNGRDEKHGLYGEEARRFTQPYGLQKASVEAWEAMKRPIL